MSADTGSGSQRQPEVPRAASDPGLRQLRRAAGRRILRRLRPAARTARAHLGHFAGEAFESITHADSRLWRTLGYLLARPGRLTREFFDGRRARYLPPFRLYLVISLLFFLVAGLPDPDDEPEAAAPTADELQGMNEAASALEEQLAETPGAAQAAAAIRAEAAGKRQHGSGGAGSGRGRSATWIFHPPRAPGKQRVHDVLRGVRRRRIPRPAGTTRTLSELCKKIAKDERRGAARGAWCTTFRAPCSCSCRCWRWS